MREILFRGQEYFSGVVKYSNEQGSFTVDDTSLHYWVSDIEVIGNVHDGGAYD